MIDCRKISIFHIYRKSNKIVANGHKRKAITVSISPENNRINAIRSKRIRIILIKIPIPRENPTNPCRYSFFHGLKKVFTNIWTENILKNARFTEAKYKIIRLGASKNQKIKKSKNRARKLCIILNLVYRRFEWIFKRIGDY